MPITGPATFDADEAVAVATAAGDTRSLAPVDDAVANALLPGRMSAVDGCRVLGAAEVIAAVRGNPSPSLPASAASWITDDAPTAADAQLADARRAVSLVASDDSELCEVQIQAYGDAWVAAVEDLLARLA